MKDEMREFPNDIAKSVQNKHNLATHIIPSILNYIIYNILPLCILFKLKYQNSIELIACYCKLYLMLEMVYMSPDIMGMVVE